MKIAFFSESYKPYLSGVTNSVETLSKKLVSFGHEVFIFAPDYPDAEKTDNIYRYPSVKAPYPGYRLAIPRPTMTIDILRQHKVDIIHSHSPYQLGLLSMWCAKKLNTPFVFTMHTNFSKYLHYIPLLPSIIKEKYMSGYIKGFTDRCDVVIVPTQETKEYLVSTGSSAKTEIIPTGVSMELFEDLDGHRIRQKYNIPADKKVLVYVGRLAKEKNMSFLLRAFRLISNKIDDAIFLIVAGGPLEEQLKQEASGQGISGKTIFAGEISYPEVLNYYAAADLFIFSSLSETQGLVLPEAMAAGLPVVAVAAEGVNDMVKDGESGFLVEHNERLFAEKVIGLLNAPDELKELRKRTRSYAQRFSADIFGKKVEDIYKSLL